MSDTTARLRAVLRTPTVMAFTYVSGQCTYTIYRTTPGDTPPRMQCDNGVFVADWGAIAEPQRFGTEWETLEQFTAWCHAFTSDVVTNWGASMDSEPVVTETEAASSPVQADTTCEVQA